MHTHLLKSIVEYQDKEYAISISGNWDGHLAQQVLLIFVNQYPHQGLFHLLQGILK